MLRLMGAALVAGGGAMAGFLAVSRLRERVRTISSFLERWSSWSPKSGSG